MLGKFNTITLAANSTLKKKVNELNPKITFYTRVIRVNSPPH
jgi:hypothetical protein